MGKIPDIRVNKLDEVTRNTPNISWVGVGETRWWLNGKIFFILQIMYEISVNDMRLEALDFFYNLLSYTAKRCALHFTAIKRNGKNLLVKSLRVSYYSVKVLVRLMNKW